MCVCARVCIRNACQSMGLKFERVRGTYIMCARVCLQSLLFVLLCALHNLFIVTTYGPEKNGP